MSRKRWLYWNTQIQNRLKTATVCKEIWCLLLSQDFLYLKKLQKTFTNIKKKSKSNRTSFFAAVIICSSLKNPKREVKKKTIRDKLSFLIDQADSLLFHLNMFMKCCDQCNKIHGKVHIYFYLNPCMDFNETHYLLYTHLQLINL